MDIRDIGYFREVAECGHMGKAAQRLFITQPALTKAVHRLEDAIGSPLLKRAGRRVVLTDLGMVLLEKARYLRQVMDDTTREVKNFAGGLAGHIRLGCSPTVTKYLLPDIVRDLQREAPGVTLEIENGMSDVLWRMLREGYLDMALTHFSGPKEGFHITPVMKDAVVVVAGRDHPIFDGKYAIEDLSRYGWVLPASAHTRGWLDDTLAKNGCPPPKVLVQASSILYLPRLIAETGLLSVISRRNIGAAEDGSLLREVVLPEMTLHRIFSMAYRKSGYQPPALTRLVGLLQTRAAAALLFPE